MDLHLALTHLMMYYVAQLRRDSNLPGLDPWLTYDCSQESLPDVAAARAARCHALIRYSSGLGVDVTAPHAADALLNNGHALRVWELIRSSIIDPSIPASREWRLRFPREIASFEILRASTTGARHIRLVDDEVFYTGNALAGEQSLRLSRPVSLTGDPANG